VSSGEDLAGPRPRTLALIGAGLLALAAALWLDAARLPPPGTVGVGPSAALRLVGGLVALLGLVHLFVAWRRRGEQVEVDHGNRAALGWVLAALAGLIAVLELDGGFVLAAAWLFVATARGFGERISIKSVAIGLVLSFAVYVFFTRALSLALPSGLLERLLLG